MRIAILISGEPRFCKDTDLFVESLKDVKNVDWFFYIWKKSQRVPLFHNMNTDLVLDKWANISSEEWAIDQISKRLPSGHRVSKLVLATVNVSWQHNHQFHGWKEVDNMRCEYEKEFKIHYDLVIKHRLDIHVTGNFNLEEINNHIISNTKTIIVPENEWWGTANHRINDQFAISSPSNMSYYCNMVNLIPELVPTSGGQFEAMLRHHLDCGGYDILPWNIKSHLRKLGETKNQQFYPNFGSWAL